MTKEIEAVYEHGIIRPLEPLELPEGSRLGMIVSTRGRAQQEINYLLTVADEKIIEALKQLSNTLAKLASSGQVDLRALNNAIQEVSETTQIIAGIIPPGCGGEPMRYSAQTETANPAETLAEIAALPLEGSSDTFSGRDHDSILYPKINDIR